MSVYVIQNITSLIIVNTHIFYFITLILFLKCLSFTVGGIVSLWVFRFLDIDWTLTLVAWQWWQLFLFQLGEGNQTVRFKPWCTFKLAPVPYSITTVDSPVSSDNPIIQCVGANSSAEREKLNCGKETFRRLHEEWLLSYVLCPVFQVLNGFFHEGERVDVI